MSDTTTAAPPHGALRPQLEQAGAAFAEVAGRPVARHYGEARRSTAPSAIPPAWRSARTGRAFACGARTPRG